MGHNENKFARLFDRIRSLETDGGDLRFLYSAGANLNVSRIFRRYPLDLGIGASASFPRGRNEGFELIKSIQSDHCKGVEIIYGVPLR